MGGVVNYEMPEIGIKFLKAKALDIGAGVRLLFIPTVTI